MRSTAFLALCLLIVQFPASAVISVAGGVGAVAVGGVQSVCQYGLPYPNPATCAQVNVADWTLNVRPIAPDPCFGAVKTNLAFEYGVANNIAIPAVGATSIYVCQFGATYHSTVGGAIFLVTAAHGNSCNSGYGFYLYYHHAQAVSIFALPVFGDGNSQTMAAVPPNYDLCLQLSGAASTLSGIIGYVQK